MRTVKLKKQARDFFKASNKNGLCVVFILVSVIFASVILAFSIRSESTEYGGRAERLTELRSRLIMLESSLNNDDPERVIEHSHSIRESSALSALSSGNRWKLYSFLRSLDTIDVTSRAKEIAYVRKCTVCIEHELAGEHYELEPIADTIDEKQAISGKNAITTARSHSMTGLYPSHFTRGEFVVTYGSNYYSKTNLENTCEYLYLNSRLDQDSDSCDIGFLRAKVQEKAEVTRGKGMLSFLFCEMGVAFFSYNDVADAIIVGISTDGERLYLYSDITK